MDDHAVDICGRCGERHERMVGGAFRATCTSHRQNGLPCKKFPYRGHHVCENHGINEPARQKIAAQQEREQLAQRSAAILADLDPSPLHADPLKGLLWEVTLSANAVEWYAQRLAELGVPVPNGIEPDLDALNHDRMGRPILPPQERDQIWGHDHNGDQAAHIMLTLWTEERERHARLCALAIRAGVSERLVALAESQAAVIADIIEYALAGVDMPPSVRNTAKSLAAGRMRSMPPVLPARVLGPG